MLTGENRILPNHPCRQTEVLTCCAIIIQEVVEGLPPPFFGVNKKEVIGCPDPERGSECSLSQGFINIFKALNPLFQAKDLFLCE